jgi:hypothetical protein
MHSTKLCSYPTHFAGSATLHMRPPVGLSTCAPGAASSWCSFSSEKNTSASSLGRSTGADMRSESSVLQADTACSTYGEYCHGPRNGCGCNVVAAAHHMHTGRLIIAGGKHLCRRAQNCV